MSPMLRTLVESFGLSAKTAKALADAFVPREIAPHERLMRAGERDDGLYFVESGLLRVFEASPEGKEHNKAFVWEGMFFVALSAYLLDEPLTFDVQALEPVRARRMPYAALDAWADRDLEVARLWRRYMEGHFVRHEMREAVLQQEDAEGRYRWFCEQYPALAERVPLYHAASYLGVTNVTISRVRRLRRRS